VLALVIVVFLLVKGLRKIKNKLPLPEEYQGFFGFFRFIRALPELQISLGGAKPPTGDIALSTNSETDAQRKERENRDKRYAQQQEDRSEDEQRKKQTQKQQEDKVKRAEEEYQKKGMKQVRNSDVQNQTLVKRSVTHTTSQGRANNQGQQQDVIVKKYPYPETTHRNEEQQKQDVREFYEEDQRRRNHKHQNVVDYVGFVSEMPNFGFVTRYYSRGSLRDALFGSRKLDLTSKQLAKFAHEVAQAVRSFHEKDQTVKYVASRNVLLDGDERNTVAKLDYTFEPSSTDSRSGNQKEYVGSVSWLAPEAMETKEYTKASDVFSFGVFLWELYARADPFENKSTIEVACPVIHKHMRLPPPSNTPEPIKNMILKCFAVTVEERPSIQEIERDLAQFYNSQ